MQVGNPEQTEADDSARQQSSGHDRASSRRLFRDPSDSDHQNDANRRRDGKMDDHLHANRDNALLPRPQFTQPHFEPDADQNIAAYDRIAGETTGQPLVSELAAVRAAFLLVDTAKLDEMTQRLEPLTQPSGAFRHTARELLALSAWRNHDTAAMRRWTEAAKNDPEAPSGVRSRMDVLASLLPEAGKP